LLEMMGGEGSKKVNANAFLQTLAKEGILQDDPRISNVVKLFAKESAAQENYAPIDEENLDEIIKGHAVVKNALTQQFVIPDFKKFCQDIQEIFEETAKNTAGKVADYIPQLARVNPDQFAVSICTVDGQRFSLGDMHNSFCLQSTCKTINYCMVLEELGEHKVHQHVGREPSGRSFNELSLNDSGLPHNPLINAGAIMTSSLIRRDLDLADRFDHVYNTWSRLCGNRKLSFNNAVYLSEKQTADRNFALAYFMREKNAFPDKTNLMETLEFYFQCCSIESCTHDVGVAAATLANSGVNPLTEEKIFSDRTIQHCMSLMLSCGMYDFSGEFAFRIGLPAKSGVSGALMVIVPNVMGISIWSPRLDKHGNSVRGVEFCERLLEKYAFHNYDSLTRQTSKLNPRKKESETKVNRLINLIYAASYGDLDEIRRLHAMGIDLGEADYDGRTALHLAAAENQINVVKYLISAKVDSAPVDRWGGTPLDDAKKSGNTELVTYLEKQLKKKKVIAQKK
ncbi:MAG: glutaminase A, partial [Bacteroidota bacterium]